MTAKRCAWLLAVAAAAGWGPLGPRPLLAGDGLSGTYFNEVDLTGEVGTHVDPTVNFPDDALGPDARGRVDGDDSYSIRWTGWVRAPREGRWTFSTWSNDGVRLWVADTPLIDNWGQHTSRKDSGAIELAAGWHAIRLEYFQQGGVSDARLLFAGPGQAEAVIPQDHLAGAAPAGAAPAALPRDNDADAAPAAAPPPVNSPAPAGKGAVVTGELRKWHKVTLTWDGPHTSETATPNPFTDYRLDVTFSGPGGQTYVVPGYYAADGDAANTGATEGSKWRVHFSPDDVGPWSYRVAFRHGAGVATADDPTAFATAGFFDGDTGTLAIADTDKAGVDLRGKGRLRYVGEHYLRFAETGAYFLKQGADAPENLLAYEDFDNTPNHGGRRKAYAPHARDWREGDPSWADGRGTELIGAVNYLASEGLNAFSFLTMNIGGDDRNVFPYLSDAPADRTRIDVSKLAQWEVVFEHAGRMGMYLHFKTQETENDQLLDGGDLGPQRRLYYRELIARFAHHLALNWNLGEENTNTDQQRKDFAQYFHDHDPYRHIVVVHTYPGDKNKVYAPLLGERSTLTGLSMQGSSANFADTHADVVTWVTRSRDAGRKWVVAVDEPGDAQHALRPDHDAGDSHEDGRRNALWGTLMGGGAGNEWYFGYGHAHSDLTLQDFRSRDRWWDFTRYALQFFLDNRIPFWEMTSDNAISSADHDYAFVKPGHTYAVYLKNGGTTRLDLTGATGTFDVRWFDPRHGGALQVGSVPQVQGGGDVALGDPPGAADEDWAVLVTRTPEAARPMPADPRAAGRR